MGKENRPLPATLHSEILDTTEAQEAKLKELEEKGWIAVTSPEGTFNGAMLVEDNEGICRYLYPDGIVENEKRK